MQARRVSTGKLPSLCSWRAVEIWIGSALSAARADQSTAQIRRGLERGNMQLWLAWDGDRARGCCITEIVESVRGRACNLVVVAGEDFAAWRPLTDTIKLWAKSKGCARLEAGGRAGWQRLVAGDGWKPVRTVIEMDLSNGNVKAED